MSKYLSSCIIVLVALGGCMMEEDVGASTGAVTIRDCDVSGAATFPGGEAFSGTMSDYFLAGGVESIDWTHDAPGTAFRTVSLNGPNQIICRQNGLVTANAEGIGTASINGVAGFDYLIETQDNRPPPTGGVPIILTANRTSRPTRWEDGEQTFSSPTEVTVPAEITVTTGDPRRQWAHLYFDDIRCKYRGDGTNYVFDKCTNDRSVAPGDVLTVDSARLHIQNGCRGTIEASVNIGSELVPAPGVPDFYRLIVWDSGGTEVYRLTTDVVNGDIAVNLH